MKRKPTPGMVTGGVEPFSVKLSRFRRSKKGIVLAVVFSVVLASSAAGVSYYIMNKKDSVVVKK